jgi:hypothetical protein
MEIKQMWKNRIWEIYLKDGGGNCWKWALSFKKGEALNYC